MIIHATAVAVFRRAVLLRGASGSGKSDLALRVLALPADGLRAFGVPDLVTCDLIADDRVQLTTGQGGTALWASAPQGLPAALEVRGYGVARLPVCHQPVEVTLLIDLVSRDTVARIPEARYETLLGVAVRRLTLDPFDASAPLKLALAAAQVPTL